MGAVGSLPPAQAMREPPLLGEPHPLCCLEDECVLGTLRAQNARSGCNSTDGGPALRYV